MQLRMRRWPKPATTRRQKTGRSRKSQTRETPWLCREHWELHAEERAREINSSSNSKRRVIEIVPTIIIMVVVAVVVVVAIEMTDATAAAEDKRVAVKVVGATSVTNVEEPSIDSRTRTIRGKMIEEETIITTSVVAEAAGEVAETVPGETMGVIVAIEVAVETAREVEEAVVTETVNLEAVVAVDSTMIEDVVFGTEEDRPGVVENETIAGLDTVVDATSSKRKVILYPRVAVVETAMVVVRVVVEAETIASPDTDAMSSKRKVTFYQRVAVVETAMLAVRVVVEAETIAGPDTDAMSSKRKVTFYQRVAGVEMATVQGVPLMVTSACAQTIQDITNRKAIKMSPMLTVVAVTTRATIKATTLLPVVAGVVADIVELAVVEVAPREVAVLVAALTERQVVKWVLLQPPPKANSRKDRKVEQEETLPMRLPFILRPL